MKSLLLLAALSQFDVGLSASDGPFDTFGATSAATVLPPSDRATAAQAAGPVVLYYPDPACPECTQFVITEFEKHGINYRIEIAPAWLVKKLPCIHWQDTGSGAWFHETFTTIDRVQRVLGMVCNATRVTKAPQIQKCNATRVTKPVATRSTSGGYYPTHGQIYDFNGVWSPGRSYMISHLQSGEHRGKFSRRWLESLSNRELTSLHDDDHRGRVKWQHVNGNQRASQAPPQRYCPT